MTRSSPRLLLLACLAASAVAQAAPLPFFDHFEADLTAWTATRLSGGNALSADAAAAFDGRKALRITYAGSAGSAQAAAVLDFSAATGTPAVRFFLFVPQATAAAMAEGTQLRLVRLGDATSGAGTGGGGADKLELLLKKDRGATFLAVEYQNTAGGTTAAGTALASRLTADTWHYVELHYQPQPSRVRLFIDDPQSARIDFSNNDTPAHAFLTAWVGLAGEASAQSGPLSFLIDGVGVASVPSGTSQLQAQHFQEYESGTLVVSDVPPGKGSQRLAPSGYTLTAATGEGAAHRGAAGLQVTDADAASGAGDGALVRTFISAASGTLYRRAWWRPVSPNGQGDRTLLAFGSGVKGGAYVAELFATGAGVLGVRGRDTNLAFSQALGTATAAAGEWHLVELVAAGLGTNSGTRTVYLDGAQAATQSGLNWAGVTVDQLAEGAVYSVDRAYQGTDRFDDVRTSRALQASGVALTVPALTDGVCSAAITVGARDSSGAARAVAEPTAVTLSSSAPGEFFSDGACTTAITSALLAVGTSSATVYFRPAAAGPATLMARNEDLLAVPSSVTVASVATQLRFTSPAQSLGAGECSAAVTVEARSAEDAPATVAQPVALQLVATSAGNGFFSDATCQSPITGLTLAAGQGSVRYHFRDTRAGASTHTVSGGGFAAVAQLQTVSAGTATRLVFTSAPVTVSAGGCSSALTLQSQDTHGNLAAVTADKLVTLGSSSPSGTFHGDGSCQSSGGSFTLTAGSSSRAVYFKDTRAGTPELTASAAGLLNAAQAQTVLAGAATALSFGSAAQSLGAGACSAATVVRLLDGFSNVATAAANLTVALSASPATVTFFSDSSCASQVTQLTLPSGASSQTFYFRVSSAGAPVITVSATNLASATQQQAVSAGTAVKLAITSAPQTLAAGGCSQGVVIRSQDGFGNPTAVTQDTAITLQSSSSTLAFYSDSGCATQVSGVPLGAGSSSATVFFKDTLAGQPTITAAATGLTDGAQVETIDPGAVSQLVFATPERSLPAGGCSAAITVQARDGFGNPTPVASNTQVALSLTGSTTGGFHAASSCAAPAVFGATIPGGQHSATVYFADTRAGSRTASASLGLGTPAEQALTVTAGTASRVGIDVLSPAIPAAGACASSSVRIEDAFGNQAAVDAELTVNLSSTSGGAVFHTDGACATADTKVTVATGGSSAVFSLIDRVAGASQLTASAAGLTSGVRTVNLTAGAPSKLAFSTAAQTLTAGQCSLGITVQSVDGSGNVVNVTADTPVAVTVSAAEGAVFSDALCQAPLSALQIDAASNAAAFFFKPYKSGQVTITASASALLAATQAQTVNPAAVAALGFVSPAQHDVQTDTCSRATVVALEDAFGNVSPGGSDAAVAITSSSATLSLFSDAECKVQLSSGLTVPAGTSTATLYWSDTRTGTPTLTAASANLTSASQQQTVRPRPPTRLAFVSPARTVATGTCSPALTVESRDASDNASPPLSDATLELTSSSATGKFYSDAQCQTVATTVQLPSTRSQVSFFYADATLGTADLAVVGPMASATQAVTVANGSQPVALALNAAVGVPEAQACGSAVAVRLLDGAGLAARATQPVTVTLTSTSPTVSFHPDSSCGTTVTRVTIGAGEYQALFHLKDTRAETVSIRATASGLNLASLKQVFSCPAVGEGVACDDQDLCNGREVCTQGSCQGGAPPACNDADSCTVDACAPKEGCSHTPTYQCCSPPIIREEANLSAAVGLPWWISPSGQVTVRGGTGPARWSACDSPPSGFSIDGTTGLVRWTPSAAGPANLCLKAEGPCGSDEWRFSLEVKDVVPDAPVAALDVPASVKAGVPFTVDARSSTGTPPLGYEWDFGDGSAPLRTDVATYTYGRPGGYMVKLTVRDAFGQAAVATTPVKATSASCAAPAVARITATTLQGDGSVEVKFGCDCPDTPWYAHYEWDFGDGTTSLEHAPRHTFAAGSWPVTLRIFHDECLSFDRARVVVTDGARTPPYCDAWVSPPSAVAPAELLFSARFSDPGGIVSGQWQFSDGLSVDALQGDGRYQRQVLAPGPLSAKLEVKNGEGLTCRAFATADATNVDGLFLPRIVSEPAIGALCRQPWQYDQDYTAEALGSAVRWSLGPAGAPEGLTIDEASGKVTWIPPIQKPGDVRVTLVAENGAGAASQDFLVRMHCPEGEQRERQCGCGASGSAPVLLALAALLLRRRRRGE